LDIVFDSGWQDRDNRRDIQRRQLISVRETICGQVNHKPIAVRACYRIAILSGGLILRI
jgi:hypothetical protein